MSMRYIVTKCLTQKYYYILIRTNSEHDYVYNIDGMSENALILGGN